MHQYIQLKGRFSGNSYRRFTTAIRSHYLEKNSYMDELFNDFLIDEKLHIRTTGHDKKNSDDHHHPYEATEYAVLDRIAEEGLITENDFLVDYGCGKGRVPIYLNYLLDCKAVGIEMAEELFIAAKKNQESYKSDAVSFVNAKAEKYNLSNEASVLFFFNPFSVEILKSVMQKVLDSYYENPRKIKLFFYYPSDEYVTYLMSIDELEFYDELDCTDLFQKRDARNKVLIFQTI